MAEKGIHKGAKCVHQPHHESEQSPLGRLGHPVSAATGVGGLPQKKGLRESGLRVMGEMAWGTHFCQFYQDQQDLVDILVPYLRAGLASNERCMWVTAGPLGTEAARAALRVLVPDLDQRADRGQIEILDYRQWYVRDGEFDGDRVLGDWVSRLNAALQSGYEGLRVAGDTSWVGEGFQSAFSNYEASVDNVLSKYRALVLCAYPLNRCSASEVIDAARHHEFALLRRGESWEVVGGTKRETLESALRESEQRYRGLFETMKEGFALHEIICDEQGIPIDYRFLDVNPAFERLTGLSREHVVGRTLRMVLPDAEQIWIDRYGKVALTGEPAQFDEYSVPLGRHYEVHAYSPAPGQFATVFVDITELKQTEERTRRQNAILQGINRILNEAMTCATQEALDRICLTVAEEVTQSKFGFIGEIDADGRLDNLAISDPGWAGSRMAIPTDPTGSGTVADGSTIHELCRRTLQSERGFFTNDPPLPPDSAGRPTSHPSVTAFLGVPLRQGGKTIGLVGLANREGGYHAEEQEALEMLSGTIVQVFMQKRAGWALRDSQADLARAQAVAVVGSWRLDVQRKELHWSDETYRIFGIPRETALTYETFLTAVHPEDRQYVDEKWTRALRGEPYDIEHRIVVGQTVKWVRERAELEFNAQGMVQSGFGTVQDITTRVKMAEALRRAHRELEMRVEERTADLRRANERLKKENEERMSAERAVEDERKRFNDVLELLPAYLILLTTDYHIRYANRFSRERFGDSCGRRCFEYLFGRETPCEACKTYKVLETMTPLEWEWTGPDGRDYHVFDSPFVDADGSTLIMEMGIDVTEPKRMAEELRTASRYARGLLEASLDPLVTLSPDGEITDVNAATETVTGRSRTELIGSDFSGYFTEPDKAVEGYRRVISDGYVRDFPLTICHRSGLMTDVLYNASVYRDEAGQLQGVFAAARDVTERKAAEKRRDVARALLEQFARKTSCQDYANSAVDLLRDWSGCHCVGIRVLTADQDISCDSFLGYGAESGPSGNWPSLGSDDCACRRILLQTPQKQDQPFMTAGGSLCVNDAVAFLRQVSPDQRTRCRDCNIHKGFASVAVVPLRYSDRILGLIHLADERKDMLLPSGMEFLESIAPLIAEAIQRFNAEAELASYRDHLEDLVLRRTDDLARSNRDLEQFAYAASHDLQEPLRAVAGFVALLQQRYGGQLDEKADGYIRSAVDGAVRMQTLIDGLLSYSRVGTSRRAAAPADARKSLDHALANLQASIEESGANIVVEAMPVIQADTVQLAQLFQNLIANAIKFRGDKPPEIAVGAQREGDAWRFWVRDNGIGIDPQYTERIFMIFQRLHTRRAYVGTGIGLAICKRIVERHGGRIWVESQLGAGSTFYFTLPDKESIREPSCQTKAH